MANYSEMRDAALNAQQRFNGMRDRAYGCLGKVVQGLITHCQVPQDKITFLKWNGGLDEQRHYYPADAGQRYSLQGAAVFDDSDGYWHLGIRISLTQLQFVSFALCVTQQDGTIKVKTGVDAKPQTLNIDNEAELRAYCESIADKVIQVYAEPKSSESRTFGFGGN